RAAALQDAGAFAKATRTSARFWSAPLLRRFGISRAVHGPNACGKSRKGALHEPYEIRVRARIESGGGPPHSKTLARRPKAARSSGRFWSAPPLRRFGFSREV